jgi:hypothetical protein
MANDRIAGLDDAGERRRPRVGNSSAQNCTAASRKPTHAFRTYRIDIDGEDSEQLRKGC